MAQEPTSASVLELLKNSSLPEVVRSELEHRILAGDIDVGERINEQKTAQALGVSRGPVREACRALVSQGLLNFVPNRGFFVCRVHMGDALEIYELRMALEAAAAGHFAERHSAAQLSRCRRLLDQMEQSAGRHDLDSYYPLNLEFHEAIAAGAGNRRLLRIHQDGVRDLHLFRTRGLMQGVGMTASHREHRMIFRALEKRDAAGAAAAMAGHIRNGKERMLAVVHSFAERKEKTPRPGAV